MIATLLTLISFASGSARAGAPQLEKLKVAAPYKIELFAKDLDQPRELTLGAKGTVFVGTRGGNVYAIRDGKTHVVAHGLNTPNGVAFRQGSLYVAEISRILRLDR